MAVAVLTFALGGHWAVLQSVAWVTMVAGYSQAEPLKKALVKTFDGRHPCPICKFVAQEKKSQEKQETQKLLIKLDFFLDLPSVAVFHPKGDSSPWIIAQVLHAHKDSPPTPPPRILPG